MLRPLKKTNLTWAAFVLTALLLVSRSQAQNSSTLVCGTVTDTLAGFSGADEKHADATTKNVKAGMAKYAVYDEHTKRLFILEPQDSAVAYVGQRITVTGTLASSPMKHAGQMVDPVSGAVEDFHRAVNDSTPIGGILAITSIAAAPVPSASGN